MKNKRNRLQLIVELIKGNCIGSQSELAQRLSDLGIDVTQATLSRDLKALKILPSQREGLGEGTHVELSYSQALQYLRREALTLPSEVPTGMVTVTYQGMPLGTAKNLGTRANNLYPKEWRIKSTYIPGQVSVIKQKS